MIRKNASVKTKKSPRRKEEVKIYKSMPHGGWVRERGFGDRWPYRESCNTAIDK